MTSWFNTVMIKCNEITWYSRLATIVVLIGVVPSVTFYIGSEYGRLIEMNNNALYVDTLIHDAISLPSLEINGLDEPDEVRPVTFSYLSSVGVTVSVTITLCDDDQLYGNPYCFKGAQYDEPYTGTASSSGNSISVLKSRVDVEGQFEYAIRITTADGVEVVYSLVGAVVYPYTEEQYSQIYDEFLPVVIGSAHVLSEKQNSNASKTTVSDYSTEGRLDNVSTSSPSYVDPLVKKIIRSSDGSDYSTTTNGFYRLLERNNEYDPCLTLEQVTQNYQTGPKIIDSKKLCEVMIGNKSKSLTTGVAGVEYSNFVWDSSGIKFTLYLYDFRGEYTCRLQNLSTPVISCE